MTLDLVLSIVVFVLATYVVLTFNRNDILDFDSKQVDSKKANEKVIDRFNFSYNEVHALQLGFVTGLGVTLIYNNLPLTATVVFLEIMLVPLGIAIHNYVYRYEKLPAVAFAHTVRSEPWYFLLPYVLTTVLGVVLVA